jgi:uncharacterized protein (TIGR03435 family)
MRSSRALLAVGIFGSEARLGDRIEALLQRGREFSPQASSARVMMSGLVLLGFVIAGSVAPRWIAFAQAPPQPAFEVASIRPADPSDKPGRLEIAPGGRLELDGVTVKMLVQQAYAISGYRIQGGPAWLDSTRYNVVAKAAGNLTLEQMRPMLETLLADRFHLVSHREKKELPMYRLVVAKNGAKFQPSANSDQQARMGMGQSNMNTLASQLGQQLGRFVSNQTGLTGDFDLHVEWTPYPGQNEGGDSDTPPPAGAEGPSIFTALQERLGLRLESTKGPVEVLVIDRAEKPDAN